MSNLGTIDTTTLVNGDTVSFQTKLYTGSGTAGQAGSSSADYVPSLWTFNIGYTPTAGTMIAVKIPVAGVNAGVWMSVDGGTTYYPVALHNKTRVTTQYGVNMMIMLIYETSAVTTTYGTTKAGASAGASAADLTSNRWSTINGYDSNTTYSAMASDVMIAGTNTTVRGMRADYLKTGLQGIIKVTNGDLQLYGTHLTGQVPAPTAANNGKILKIASGAYSLANEMTELPSVSSSDNTKVLTVVSGAWAAAAAPSGLPSVSSSDNGKVLRVVEGAWAAASLPSASGVSF